MIDFRITEHSLCPCGAIPRFDSDDIGRTVEICDDCKYVGPLRPNSRIPARRNGYLGPRQNVKVTGRATELARIKRANTARTAKRQWASMNVRREEEL